MTDEYAVHLLSYVLQQPICKGQTPFSANEVTNFFVRVLPVRFVLGLRRIEIRWNRTRCFGKTPFVTYKNGYFTKQKILRHWLNTILFLTFHENGLQINDEKRFVLTLRVSSLCLEVIQHIISEAEIQILSTARVRPTNPLTRPCMLRSKSDLSYS